VSEKTCQGFAASFCALSFHQASVSSDGHFIKHLFHQTVISSGSCFIKQSFHQVSVSSSGRIIKHLFHHASNNQVAVPSAVQ
jgi:hypothetical protein